MNRHILDRKNIFVSQKDLFSVDVLGMILYKIYDPGLKRQQFGSQNELLPC